MRVILHEPIEIDGVVYLVGEHDLYWPIAQAICRAGIGADPTGRIQTGRRDAIYLQAIGITLPKSTTESA